MIKPKYKIITDDLAGGDEGVKLTIKHMRRLALRDSNDVAIKNIANMIIKEANTDLEAAELIYNFIQNKVNYKKDPKDEEHITAPRLLLTSHTTGDCDCQATAYAAVALAVANRSKFKLKPAFKTIAWDKSRGDDFTHVYCIVFIPSINKYVPVDTVPGMKFRTERDKIFRSNIYRI